MITCPVCQQRMEMRCDRNDLPDVPDYVLDELATALWDAEYAEYLKAKASAGISPASYCNYDEYSCRNCGTVGIEWAWEDGIHDWYVGDLSMLRSRV